MSVVGYSSCIRVSSSGAWIPIGRLYKGLRICFVSLRVCSGPLRTWLQQEKIFNCFSLDSRMLLLHSEDCRLIRRVPGGIGFVRSMCSPLPDSAPSMVSQWQRIIGYSNQGVADDSRGHICARSFVALTHDRSFHPGQYMLDLPIGIFVFSS